VADLSPASRSRHRSAKRRKAPARPSCDRLRAGAGRMAAWIDPTASFDPLAAQRAKVDLERLVVGARARAGLALATAAALRSEGSASSSLTSVILRRGVDVDDIAAGAVRGPRIACRASRRCRRAWATRRDPDVRFRTRLVGASVRSHRGVVVCGRARAHERSRALLRHVARRSARRPWHARRSRHGRG